MTHTVGTARCRGGEGESERDGKMRQSVALAVTVTRSGTKGGSCDPVTFKASPLTAAFPSLLCTHWQTSMILVGVAALVVESARCPDMSSGFGLMSVVTQRLLYQQLGVVLLCAVVLVMLATAKSLCVQMNRPVPKVFPRLLWGLVAANQVFGITILVRIRRATHSNNAETITAGREVRTRRSHVRPWCCCSCCCCCCGSDRHCNCPAQRRRRCADAVVGSRQQRIHYRRCLVGDRLLVR